MRSSSMQRLHPLLLSLLILAGGVALYFIIRLLFFGSAGDAHEATLLVPSGETVYVELQDDNGGPRAVSTTSFPFFENETVDSRSAENGSVELFDNSKITLDRQTQLRLEKSRELDGGARDILVTLQNGRLWVEVSPSLNPRALFEIGVGHDRLVQSNNGRFSVDLTAGLVKVGGGTVRVSEMSNGEESFYQEVGVGQQFSFTGTLAANTLAAVATDDWFTAHQSGEAIATDTTPADGAVEGDDSPVVPVGTATSAKTVEILTPGKNNAIVAVSEPVQKISGTLPKGTAKVVVNDYTLQKFSAGDTEFSYTAAVDFDSLKEGRNEYEVRAYDEDGKLLSSAKIALIYTKGSAAETDETSAETSSETPTGTLAITAPNGGKDGTMKDTAEVLLTGTAPSNAAKITVNGYALSKFVTGNSTWNYRIREDLGNMKEGENLYEVKAYDTAGKLLGSDSITLTFPKLPEKAPATTASESSTTTTTSSAAESSGTGSPSATENSNPDLTTSGQ